ncbi:MAG: hypothetical protein L6E13_00615 [Firmicutes bacterium]|nr:hypothetical protein [Bacillota bacterium]
MEDERWDRYRDEVRYRDPYLEPPPTWADRFERILIQLVNLGLVVLAATLLIMTQPQIRRAVVLLERLEGSRGGSGGPGWQQVPGNPGLPAGPQGVGPQPAPGGGSPPAPAGGAENLPAPSGSPGAQTAPTGNGGAVPATAPLAPARISLALLTRARAPEVRLLVGSRVAGDFGSGRVEATVRPGETVTVDGTGAPGGLTFRVVAADGFLSHLLGREVTTRGDRQVLVSPGER